MKKTYKKPITEVLPMLFTDYQMNTREATGSSMVMPVTTAYGTTSR